MHIREAVTVRVKGKFITMTHVILILHKLSNILVLVPTYILTFLFTADSVDCTTYCLDHYTHMYNKGEKKSVAQLKNLVLKQKPVTFFLY